MVSKFTKDGFSIFVNVWNSDLFLFEEISNLLISDGYALNTKLNFEEKNKWLKPIMLVKMRKQIRKKLMVTIKLRANRIAVKVYLQLRQYSISRNFVYRLKNKVQHALPNSVGLDLSQPIEDMQSEKDFMQPSILEEPSIFLTDQANFEVIRDFAISNSLSTFSMPSSNLIIVAKMPLGPDKDLELDVSYPVPYSYIKNSYFGGTSRNINSMILISDSLPSLGAKNIYFDEIVKTCTELQFRKLVLITSLKDTDFQNELNEKLEIQNIDIKDINLSNFGKVRSIFEEDCVIIEMNENPICWMSDFSSIARIPYLNLNSIGFDESKIDYADVIYTLLGKIRLIPIVLSNLQHSSLIQTLRPNVRFSEDIWREKFEQIISRIAESKKSFGKE